MWFKILISQHRVILCNIIFGLFFYDYFIENMLYSAKI